MNAPEPTPLIQAAEALLHYDTNGLCDLGKACGLCDCGMNLLGPTDRDQRTRREVDRARYAAEALLAGDWLERVLHQHQVVKRQYVHDVNDTMHTLCTCDALVPDGPGYDFVKPFIAHQAAAVVAYATGGAA